MLGYLNWGLFLFSFVMSFFFCRRLDCILPRKKNPLLRLFLLVVIAFPITMPAWVGDENSLYFLPFFALAFLLGFEGPLLPRLTLAGILYPLFISCGMMIDSLELPELANWGASYDVLVRLLKISVYLAILLFLYRIVPKNTQVQLSAKLWRLVGLLALAPLFAQFTFVFYNPNRLFDSNEVYRFIARMAYTVLPFVVLAALALLYAVVMLSRYWQMEQHQQLGQLNLAYYEQLERQQKQVRRLRHDMANHLQTLCALSSEEKDAYLAQLLDSPALRSPAVWSDNRVVNAVLTAKAAEMAEAQIRGDLSAPVPELLPFTDVDLCAMLANGLDNAIEACRKLPGPMRKITCKVRVDKGLFLLRVVNPCPEEPREENGRILTSKPDHLNHGLGLEGLRSIAEKYGGSFRAGLRGGDFELLLALPLQ